MFKKNKEKAKKEKAFTLIELMLVVLVIGILAGIVGISLSGQRERALEKKILVELSGMIQPLLTCISDGHNFWLPTTSSNGHHLCLDEIFDDETAFEDYGAWLNVEPFGYSCLPCSESSGGGICKIEEVSNDWYFSVDPLTDSGNIICCNAKSEKCAIISGPCNNTIDL